MSVADYRSAEPRRVGENNRIKLDFLDGIRGIAAMFVVLHHGLLEVSAEFAHSGHHFSPLLQICSAPLLAGRFGVDVFIVVSGFCLALPLARAKRDRLASIPKFFLRRCWRILPPYYAALFLTMLMLLIVPSLSHRTGEHWDIVLPAFTPRAVISHLLLIHNLSSTTAFRINHAMWSVATECQIYLLFPVLLLPIRRSFGMIWLVLISFAIGISIHRVFPSLDAARPWYLGLFALGMGAAEISFSQRSACDFLRRNGWWLWLAVLPLAGLAQVNFLRSQVWFVDAVVGAAACLMITACTHAKLVGTQTAATWIVRLFEHRQCLWLGTMSYSLYLIHPPLIALANQWGGHVGLTPAAQVLFVLSLGSIASLMAAQAFFVGIEQWFISNPPKPALPPQNSNPGMIPILPQPTPAVILFGLPRHT